jgi:hypothetical protein
MGVTAGDDTVGDDTGGGDTAGEDPGGVGGRGPIDCPPHAATPAMGMASSSKTIDGLRTIAQRDDVS